MEDSFTVLEVTVMLGECGHCRHFIFISVQLNGMNKKS